MSLTATERAEYWILTHLVDSLCPSWALRQEQVGYYYADYHGLTNQELIAVLSDLSLRGDLTAYRYDAVEDTDEHYVPLLAEIEAAILTAGRDPVVTFCLTSQRGARWEEFFQPDWDKFLGGGFYYSDDMRYWELEATTKSPIEKYLVDCGVELRYRHRHLCFRGKL